MKSKVARRPMLPRDIWSLKGVVGGGTDTTIFRDKIREMWGRYPLNIYAFTEAIVVAVQTWDYRGMTFLPHLNFLEFIPEEESLRSREDPEYQPKTLFLNEVRAGEKYELVITNFHGGALVRYRNGDMVKITSLRNEQLNIDIPQMEFHSRVDDLIDIAGFTRLTERIIWQAIERSGVACKDWTARKEDKEQQKLHIYLELKENGHQREEEVTLAIHQQLKELDRDYTNLESFLGLRALEVTLLPENAFQAYKLKQQAAGAELARLKIPHINPSDDMLDFLTSSSRQTAILSSAERQPASAQIR
jgi:phenylacetate-coenzyme A ligase PaaK-like adenylate-forming protein